MSRCEHLLGHPIHLVVAQLRVEREREQLGAGRFGDVHRTPAVRMGVERPLAVGGDAVVDAGVDAALSLALAA